MPFMLRQILEQIPLPSLRYYAVISSAVLVAHVAYCYYLIQSTVHNLPIETNSTNHTDLPGNATVTELPSLTTMLLSQPLSRLILMNTLYCSLVLLAQKLQVFVFGELRPVELQRVKDKFWNYAFYKFCFLFGVLGVESVNELSLWISWFFSLAFALVFCQLIKDRFELLTVSISTPRQSLTRTLYLLLGILCLCPGLFAICVLVGLKFGGVSIFFFMLAEISLLTLDTTYLLMKYIFIQHPQPSNEHRSHMFYYLEFFLDVLALTIDILYHLQMLCYHQTFMSMSSFILLMQLKPLFNELTQRLKRHKSYRLAVKRMEGKYPLLTREELEEKARKQKHVSSLEEICSICWEKFEKARCLPCGHVFHQYCLHGWLEQDASCPICRVSLQDDPNVPPQQPRFWQALANAYDMPVTDPRHGRNHLFRFDGYRYSSWLPTFSIVINHNFAFRFGRPRLSGVQLTSMAQSVQQIFPQIPFEIILSDLQRTQSIDSTIENIVEQRIQFEPQLQDVEEEDGGEEEEEEGGESSELEEHSQELSDGEETNRRDRLLNHLDIINDNSESFTWPLDSSLPFDHRKQLLISHMRRQYLEHERRLHQSDQ